jgi:short subunit dehydrogenase-like uncharacterized protein
MSKILIYGAYGYTGRKIAIAAKERGIDTVLAGRNTEALQQFAEKLGMEWRNFGLDDANQVKENLEGIDCVVNAAGPFYKTSKKLIDACISVGSHYLDITGEIGVFNYAEEMSDVAAQAGIMLMPGVGWDIVPTDCIGLHTARRANQPQSIRLFIRFVDLVPTRGSMRTLDQFDGLGNLVRRDGELVTIDDAMASYDVGLGTESYRISPLPDVITTWKSTGIPNISVYGYDPGVEPGPPLTPEQIDALPEGGNDEETKKSYSLASAEVTDIDGNVFRSTIRTISPYAYTGEMVAEIAGRILQGDFKRGFQSPAAVYGPELACSNGIGNITDL